MQRLTTVSTAVSGGATPPCAPDAPYWWSLADPLRRVARYLFARDRARLGSVSRTFHAVLAMPMEIALERAGQVCTTSRLREVLVRLAQIREASHHGTVLGTLAQRLEHIPALHRRAAWNAMLAACHDLTSAQAHAATLASLAGAAVELRDGGDCLDHLHQRASVLAQRHRATVIPAILSAALLQRPQGPSAPSRPPFDLRACLALVWALDAEDAPRALGTVIGYQGWRLQEVDPDAAWREALDAVRDMDDPRQRAAVLRAMTQRLPAPPAQAWYEALEVARTLPAESAAAVAVALLWPGCYRRVAPPADPLEALWQFSLDRRFNDDQRSEIVTALLRVAPDLAAALTPSGRWWQAWDALLQRCQREGISDLRCACLTAQFRAAMQLDDADLRQRVWDAVYLAGQALEMPATLAALLCQLLAGHLGALRLAHRPAAAQRLLDWIDGLQPASLGYQPAAEVFTHMAHDTLTAISAARLAAVPAAVRAAWLTRLLSSGAGLSLALVQATMEAVRCAPHTGGDRPALLTTAIGAVMHACRAGNIEEDAFASFVAAVPAAVEDIDLAYEPALARYMGQLELMVRQHAGESTVPAHAARYLQYMHSMRVLARAMPAEPLQTLLIALQEPKVVHEHLSSAFPYRYEPAFILDVIGGLPAAYRAPVLMRWIAWSAYRCGEWPQRYRAWCAIQAVPAKDQAGLLWECRGWFDKRRRAELSPDERPGWEAARAQWLAAISRLPQEDALNLGKP